MPESLKVPLDFSEALPGPSEPHLDHVVGHLIDLTQEKRWSVQSENPPHHFPNFTTLLQISGRWMLGGDLIALVAGFVAGGFGAYAINTLFLKGTFQELLSASTLQQIGIFLGLGLMALFWFDTKGHYRQRLPHWEMVGHILAVALIGFIGSGFMQFAAKNPSSRLWMGLSWTLFGSFLFIGRHTMRQRLTRNGLWQIPALIIGKGTTAQGALKALSRERQMGFTIVGQIPAHALSELEKPHAWKHLLMTHDACHIFLALEGSELERHPAALKSMVRARVPTSIVPPWLGLPSSTLSPHHFMMHDVMMMHDTNRLELPMLRFLKRSFDIIVSGTAIVLLIPVLVAVGLMVKRDGGKAFFTQSRVGKGGTLFNCFKFRSMRSDAEEILAQYLAQNPEASAEWQKFQKLKHDVRITPFGQWIRKTSLDELPQLFNVLRGDMSLVGPRPCMPGQESFYAEDFSFYESVRPGITGPWQVSGRNKLTFKERVALESWYARNWSLWMDIVILLKTVPTLLKKDGAF